MNGQSWWEIEFQSFATPGFKHMVTMEVKTIDPLSLRYGKAAQVSMPTPPSAPRRRGVVSGSSRREGHSVETYGHRSRLEKKEDKVH